LDLAVESGYCLFNLAIESGSDKTLERIKKPIRVAESIELVNLIRKKYPKIWMNGFFIVGFPFETKAEILHTLKFSTELNLDWACHYIFKPFPGTELYDECLSEGVIDGFNWNYGDNFRPSELDGTDWDRHWLYDTNYEYNLRCNFVENKNLLGGRESQALRDFEYVISITSGHALAYRQAALASRRLGLHDKAKHYEEEAVRLSQPGTEFHHWYDRLGLISSVGAEQPPAIHL
jgi:radical SAM superfamily enzyme YgiQ (UPF0313 family)